MSRFSDESLGGYSIIAFEPALQHSDLLDLAKNSRCSEFCSSTDSNYARNSFGSNTSFIVLMGRQAMFITNNDSTIIRL